MKKSMGFSNGLVCYGVSFAVASFLASLQSAQAQGSPETAVNSHQTMSAEAGNPHQAGAAGSANPHQAQQFITGDRKDVSWKLPEGWSELTPTSMRLGNFLYTHSNGQKVEITVASLPGAAGGIAPNFEMWRSQVGLPSIDEVEVLKQSEKVHVGDLEMTMTDIVSSENIIDNKFKARITGAIYVRGPNTWFFKMKGEDTAVKSSKKAFLSFLKDLKFQDSSKG